MSGVRESEYNPESGVAAAVLLKMLGTAVHSPPRSQRAARGKFMAITITVDMASAAAARGWARAGVRACVQ